MPTKSEHSSKLLDVVTDNLKDTLLAVDRSFLLAVIAAAFVTIYGGQGAFDRDAKEWSEYHAKKSSQSGQAEIIEKPPSHEVEIPILGFKTGLLDAAVVSMILYCVFVIRAALRVRRVGVLASRLSLLDKEVHDALLLYPSLATAGRGTKILSCVFIGALGWSGDLMWRLPHNRVLGDSVCVTLAGSALIMFTPAAILCWQLLRRPSSTLKSSNTA